MFEGFNKVGLLSRQERVSESFFSLANWSNVEQNSKFITVILMLLPSKCFLAEKNGVLSLFFSDDSTEPSELKNSIFLN